MRYNTFFIALLLIVVSACTSNTKEKNSSLEDQIASLTEENEKLRSQNRVVDPTVSNYRRKLEEIDYNLRTIELNLVTVENLNSGSGRDIPVEERIQSRLEIIQKLIRNSNLKIKSLDQNLDDLRTQAKDKSKEVLALERVMKNAAKVLISKEEEFNDKQAALGGDAADVEKTYEEQLAITFELYKIVNRAYFIKGTEKDLQKLGILGEDGIFVGIDKVKILNATLVNSPFELLEKDKKGSFVFNEDRVRVLTTHHEASYTVKKTPSKNVLTVKDKKAFWKNGNYLIIQTN